MGTIIGIMAAIIVLGWIYSAADRKHKRNTILDHQYQQVMREKQQLRDDPPAGYHPDTRL